MAKKKILIDSSALVALYNPQDNQHQKAKKLIRSLSQKENAIFLHSLVILEVLTVLKQKAPPLVLKKVKNYLFNPNLYVLIKEKCSFEADESLFEIFEKNKNISLVDAKLIELCLISNFTLLSLDKNLKKVCQNYKIETDMFP